MRSFYVTYIYFTLLLILCVLPADVYAEGASDNAVAPQGVSTLSVTEDAVPGRVLLTWDAPQYDIEGSPLVRGNLSYMVYMSVDEGELQPLYNQPVIVRTLIYEVCKPMEKAVVSFSVLPFNCDTPALSPTYSEKLIVGRAEGLPYFNGFTPSDQDFFPLITLSDGKDDCTLQFVNSSNSTIASGDDDGWYAVASAKEADTSVDIISDKVNLTGTHNPEMSIRHYKWDDSDINRITLYALTSEGSRKEIAVIDHNECTPGWNTFVCDLSPLKRLQPQILLHIDFLSPHSVPFDTMAIYQAVDSVEEISQDAISDITFEIKNRQLIITDQSGHTPYTLCDISGRIIRSQSGSSIHLLSPGLYLLQTPAKTHPLLIP